MLEIIPEPSLEKWAIKKFREHCTTMDLMATAKDNHDLTAIAIVALLEVNPSSRYLGMCEEEIRYMQSCHKFLRSLINDPSAACEPSTL